MPAERVPAQQVPAQQQMPAERVPAEQVPLSARSLSFVHLADRRGPMRRTAPLPRRNGRESRSSAAP
jgi:hypothetical protein